MINSSNRLRHALQRELVKMNLKIETGRLVLIAETAELAAAAEAGRGELAAALEAEVPEEWPPEGTADAMALFAARLRREPTLAGWLAWYWVRPDPVTGSRTLIGDGGFTSPPVDGTVATGYSLLPAYRGKGYATEAVRALVEWAFAHQEVRKVIAETLPDNKRSIRVLQRAGFMRARKASEPGHLRFVLKRP
jgi:[ribosomal protein S5]-alanine N-acetyltransferase